MSESAPAPNIPAVTTLAVAPPKREIRVVESQIALFDTAKFEHMTRIAAGMARATLIPEHLCGSTFEETQGNCFLITNQAMRWDVDPFALAAESYMVKGKLGFQGKVIMAIIEDRLHAKLKYRYNKAKGNDLAIVVYLPEKAGPLTDEAKALLIALADNDDKSALSDLQDDHGIRAVRLSVGQARTPNDIWNKDPEQKLVYSGSVRWARRYEPGIIMGIKSDDDLERAQQESLSEIPKAALPPSPNQAPPTSTVTDNKPEVVSAPAKAKRVASRPTPAEPAKPTDPEPQPAPTEPEAKEPAPEPVKEEPAKPAPDKSPFTLEPEAPKTGAGSGTLNARLLAKVIEAGFTGDEMLNICLRYRMAPVGTTRMEDVPEEQCGEILGDWDNALDALKSSARKGAK